MIRKPIADSNLTVDDVCQISSIDLLLMHCAYNIIAAISTIRSAGFLLRFIWSMDISVLKVIDCGCIVLRNGKVERSTFRMTHMKLICCRLVFLFLNLFVRSVFVQDCNVFEVSVHKIIMNC